jgi:non-homologous end joining protein Ku
MRVLWLTRVPSLSSLRQGASESTRLGIGKLALYGREYLVAVKPMGSGIVM